MGARSAPRYRFDPLITAGFLLTKTEGRSNLFFWMKTSDRVWLEEVGCHAEKMARCATCDASWAEESLFESALTH
jgi:hypothetical protein